MKFHGGGRDLFRQLWASFKAGPAASAERFISDHDVAGIFLVPLPHTVHAGINAGPAMEAMFFVNEDMVSRKGLPLFTNLLVEPCSDHIEEPVELWAIFNLLDEANHFLNREVDILGQIFFQIFVKLAMV
jgi:hypothetical protein